MRPKSAKICQDMTDDESSFMLASLREFQGSGIHFDRVGTDASGGRTYAVLMHTSSDNGLSGHSIRMMRARAEGIGAAWRYQIDPDRLTAEPADDNPPASAYPPDNGAAGNWGDPAADREREEATEAVAAGTY